MSDTEKKNSVAVEESVDDILAGILNPDGSFNDEFNGLFAKYVGTAQEPYSVSSVDLSDRRGEVQTSEKVEYESADAFVYQEKTADDRIEEKLPESIKSAFSEAAKDAQRPEFTATGDVRYPTIGVGASEQRVVFDADWEESAKREAARRERVRQDRMLRGDSAYARGFVTRESYINTPSPYIQQQPASPYIDPLSVDSDLERPDVNSEYFSSTRKPFFPEGFSVVQRNSVASSGKTERTGSSRTAYGSAYSTSADKSWLQVEEKPEKKKKKGFFGKKKKGITVERQYTSVEDAIEKRLAEENAPEKEETPEKPHTPVFSGEELKEVQEETAGLRSTVAEIVDKYNKRSEEEEKRKLEELVRQEELRREEELRERRRLEEIRVLKEQMSPELCVAVETEEEDGSFDDFSTVPAEEKKSLPQKNFSVVFDPKALSGDEFTEKLDSSMADEAVTENEKAGCEDKNKPVKENRSQGGKSKKKKKR